MDLKTGRPENRKEWGDGGLSRLVIGAALAVHEVLGPGFLESIYQRALQVELEARGVPFVSQIEVPVTYRGEVVGRHRLDLVVDGRLVVELKSAEDLHRAHRTQLRSYLTATGLNAGLLLNFGQPKLQIRRIQ